MNNLVLFILISVGITNIIQNESIFAWFRKLLNKYLKKVYDFVICPACFGFWIGVLISFLFTIQDNMILNAFYCGIISSICNRMYAKLNRDEFGEV